MNLQITNWLTSSSADSKAEIQLLVPPGQVSLGIKLIDSMYEPVPDLTGLEQEQLLHLITLADRYSVQKVLVAAASAIAAIPQADLAWQTVMAMYCLPPGAAAAAGCNGAGTTGSTGSASLERMYAACSAKMQLVLGDLEVSVADPEKWQQLLALPYAAVKQLLEAPDTRAASEHTVYYVI